MLYWFETLHKAMEDPGKKREREEPAGQARVCNYACCDPDCKYRTHLLFDMKRHFVARHWAKGKRYPTKFTQEEFDKHFHGCIRQWPASMKNAFKPAPEDANATDNDEDSEGDDDRSELQKAIDAHRAPQDVEDDNDDGDGDLAPPGPAEDVVLIDRHSRTPVTVVECPVGCEKKERCKLQKSGHTHPHLLLDMSQSRAVRIRMHYCTTHGKRFSEERAVLNDETDLAVNVSGEMQTVIRVTPRVLATANQMVCTATAFNEHANMAATYRATMLSQMDNPPCERTAQLVAMIAAKLAYLVFQGVQKKGNLSEQDRRKLRVFGMDFTFQTAPVVTFEGTTRKYAFVIGTAVSREGFPLHWTIAASECEASVRELTQKVLKCIEENADLPEGCADRRHAEISIDNWHQYHAIVTDAAREVGWTCTVHQDWFHFVQRINRVSRSRHSDKKQLMQELKELHQKLESIDAQELAKQLRQIFTKYQKTVSADPNHGKLLHEFEMMQALVACLRNPAAEIRLMVETGSGVLQTIAAHKFFERYGFTGENALTDRQMAFVTALFKGCTLQNERLHSIMKSRLPTKGTNSVDLLCLKIELVFITRRLGFFKGDPSGNALNEAARLMRKFDIDFSTYFGRQLAAPTRLTTEDLRRLGIRVRLNGDLDATECDLVMATLEEYCADPSRIRGKSKSVSHAISQDVFQGTRTPSQIMKFIRHIFATISAPAPDIEKEIGACAAWIGKSQQPAAKEAEPEADASDAAENSEEDSEIDAQEAREIQNFLAPNRAPADQPERPEIPRDGLATERHVLRHNTVIPLRQLGKPLDVEEATLAARQAYAVALGPDAIVFISTIKKRQGAQRDHRPGDDVWVPNAKARGQGLRGVLLRGPLDPPPDDPFEIFNVTPWRCEYFCFQQWFWRKDATIDVEAFVGRDVQEWVPGRSVTGWPLPNAIPRDVLGKK